MLRVLDSGVARVRLDRSPAISYNFLFLTLIVVANLVGRWVLFHGGSTVYVEVPGRKPITIRMRSRDAAAGCMREVAEAVERGGVVAVDRWPDAELAGGRGPGGDEPLLAERDWPRQPLHERHPHLRVLHDTRRSTRALTLQGNRPHLGSK